MGYQRFSRSREGYSGGSFPGVTLHFKEFLSEREAFLIFNAAVLNKSGVLRKRNQFLPPKNGSLVKFWLRTVGDLPNGRRSRIWEYMGKLKPHLFQMNTRIDGKGENKSAGLLNIPFDEIRSSLVDDRQPDYGPKTDTLRTNHTDDNYARTQGTSGLQEDITECHFDYEISQKENTILRDIPVSKDVNNQSVEEWLKDYFLKDD